MWGCDDTPRSVLVQPRNTSGSSAKRTVEGMAKEEKLVLDVMLAESTGPILAILWSKSAQSFLQLIQSLPMKSIPSKAIFNVHGFRITTVPKNDWNGNILTTIRVFHSKDTNNSRPGTTPFILPAANSPFLMDAVFQPPHFPACVSAYAMYRSKIGTPTYPWSILRLFRQCARCIRNRSRQAEKVLRFS